ncbi:CagC family type IV secretion system protein [Enterococcus hirae]
MKQGNKVKRIFEQGKWKLEAVIFSLGCAFGIPEFVYAADPQEKLVKAGNTVKAILTALVAIVGAIAATKLVVKYLPYLDDPVEKNNMSKSLVTVLLVTAIGGALPWIVPWAYSLFQ